MKRVILYAILLLLVATSAKAILGSHGMMMSQSQPPSGGGGGGGPGTVACDVGPPFQGAIPGPAAAFGLTHCINFDFSYTGNFTNAVSYYDVNATLVPAGKTYNWGTRSSWLNVSGGGLFTSNGFLDPTNQIQFVTDSTSPGGGQVLLLQTTTAGVDRTQGSGLSSIAFPGTNAFYEITYKLSPSNSGNLRRDCTLDAQGHPQNPGTGSNACAINGELTDFFAYRLSNAQGSSAMETDFGAVCAANHVPLQPADCATSQVLNAFDTPGNIGGLDPNTINVGADGNWHVIGNLYVSSQSKSLSSWCGYIDHTEKTAFQGTGGGCRSPRWTSGSSYCTGPPNSIICYQSSNYILGSYAIYVTAPVQQWVKSLVFWVCPKWNAATNSVPSGTPPNANMTSGCDSGSESVPIPNDGDHGPAWPSN